MTDRDSSTLPLNAGDGFEFGRFRLKPGITEEQMRAAHSQMVANYLSKQDGWRGQYAVRLEEGLFYDISFAVTRDRAEEICMSWHGQPDCEAFLALIEADHMGFGEIL